jgi:Domain of unknown function (DUF4398)
MPRVSLVVCVLAIIVLWACAEPPSKEMNQAQGAIDAAKAAGAEAFAPTELTAAVDALRHSEEAVTQRDYRLALNLALESRERAQAAAKTAVTARANARGEIEGQIGQATTLLSQARARLRDPDMARLPRRTLQDARAAVDAANKALQDARTALNNDDYVRAKQTMEGVTTRIQTAITAIDNASGTQPARRRR